MAEQNREKKDKEGEGRGFHGNPKAHTEAGREGGRKSGENPERGEGEADMGDEM